MMDYREVMRTLEKLGNPDDLEGMSRFGISTTKAMGVRVWDLRRIAKEIKRDHDLALRLWASGIHEARMLATMVGDPKRVTEELMEEWVRDFDSWDITDQCCGNLFDRTPWAYEKAVEWSEREEEFEKRAGFVLMATLSVHDKKASDDRFEAFFPIILREAHDERNFVKKAVNWALRQIGKRNLALNARAIEVGEEVLAQDTKAARWIARDALKELRSDKVMERLERKAVP
jgi:3-methyladenine DNA glycosylase AlkD